MSPRRQVGERSHKLALRVSHGAGNRELRSVTALYAALDEAPGGRRLRLTILRGATEQRSTWHWLSSTPPEQCPPETAGGAAHDEHLV